MGNKSPRPLGRSLRGFASMDKAKQREIASKGGKAAHEKGTAHEFNTEEASAAAKKGHQRGTAHEFTKEEARVAGKLGGLARAAKRRKQLASASAPNPVPLSSDIPTDVVPDPLTAPAVDAMENEGGAVAHHAL